MVADALALWDRLDPSGPADVAWPRALAIGTDEAGSHAVILLGAFDPLTNAHVAIVRGAARFDNAAAAFCMTKVLLARGGDQLFAPRDRIGVIMNVADRSDIGVAFANRGTYLEVGRAMRGRGVDPTFVIGADKLGQLADPSFYEDGPRGVDATFAEMRFIVVPRDDVDITPFIDRDAVRVLDVGEAFDDPSLTRVSASGIRRSLRSGEQVDHLVPPEVAEALRGYTSAR